MHACKPGWSGHRSALGASAAEVVFNRLGALAPVLTALARHGCATAWDRTIVVGK